VRTSLAAEVSALIRHAGLGLEDACQRAIRERILPLRGDAGMIALDPEGNVAMPANTTVMHRGVVRNGGAPETAVYVK
jgi:beta-aspartyl-peptidase (threonine type)